METLQSVNIGVWYNEAIHQIYHDHLQYQTENFMEAQAFAKICLGTPPLSAIF
jgi:hypothetical protein